MNLFDTQTLVLQHFNVSVLRCCVSIAKIDHRKNDVRSVNGEEKKWYEIYFADMKVDSLCGPHLCLRAFLVCLNIRKPVLFYKCT